MPAATISSALPTVSPPAFCLPTVLTPQVMFPQHPQGMLSLSNLGMPAAGLASIGYHPAVLGAASYPATNVYGFGQSTTPLTADALMILELAKQMNQSGNR